MSTDLPPIANFLSKIIFILLIIVFLYALSIRFVSDETLFDRTLLDRNDQNYINYLIEPPPKSGQSIPFPSVFDVSNVYMTLVVPAYNEERRLPGMLDVTLEYLRSRETRDNSFTWEIIVVNDGSKDRTADIVIEYAKENPEIRLLRQPKNMGKGAAIQAGSLHSRGNLILMVDADGATKISELEELEAKIKLIENEKHEAITIGSRAHLNGNDKANRTPLREFMGKAFHLLIFLTGVRGIEDTQCGFKLFTRPAARYVFANQHVQRWAFDPELLMLATKRGIPIAEVPVEWNEIELDSKINMLSIFNMAIDLLKVALFYPLGLWTIKIKNSNQAKRQDPIL